MSVARLRTLLADARLRPGNIGELEAAANEWFLDQPSAASFVVRALFQELSAGGWSDEQGVPVDDLAALEAALLPPLNALLDSLDSGGKGVLDAIDALAKARRNHLD